LTVAVQQVGYFTGFYTTREWLDLSKIE